MRLKYLLIGIAAAMVIPIAVVAWWLLSPLFIDKTVDEDLPFARSAVVPAGMTPGEVEQIMAGMAKVNQEVDEPMPAEMMTSPGAGNANAADATATQPAAVALKQGAFQDADNFHQGSGRATLYRAPDGSHLLRLEDFMVTNGPDLHVILTPHPNPESRSEVDTPGYVDLGSLKGNVGNQNYVIPDHVDVAAMGSVVIYCKPFHVVFSVASLENLS
jgi:Electron transfer DM13